MIMATAMVCGMAGCAAPAKETKNQKTQAAAGISAAEAEVKTEGETSGEKILVGVLVYNDKNEYIQKHKVSKAFLTCADLGLDYGVMAAHES